MRTVNSFKQFFPIAEALSALLFPHAEVVLHNSTNGKVVKIWNAFSSRKAGDDSHLDDAPELFDENAVYGPYEKGRRDGGRTKSITAILHDHKGEQIGYFCVNLNVTMLDSAIELLQAFVIPKVTRPESIYHNDIQEHVNYLIHDYLQGRNKALDALSREERAQLVAVIETAGVFQARNSVPLVAKALSLSRASIYNLLALARSNASGSESA